MADTKRAVPLWIKALLVVSLALNLVVVGLVAGAMMRRGGQPLGPLVSNYAMPYVAALPRADRRAIFGDLRAAAAAGQVPKRQDLRGLFAEMLGVLSAETWDAAQAREILRRQLEGTAAVQRAAQEAWLARIGSLSAQERQAYAARVRAVLERRRSPRP